MKKWKEYLIDKKKYKDDDLVIYNKNNTQSKLYLIRDGLIDKNDKKLVDRVRHQIEDLTQYMGFKHEVNFDYIDNYVSFSVFIPLPEETSMNIELGGLLNCNYLLHYKTDNNISCIYIMNTKKFIKDFNKVISTYLDHFKEDETDIEYGLILSEKNVGKLFSHKIFDETLRVKKGNNFRFVLQKISE